MLEKPRHMGIDNQQRCDYPSVVYPLVAFLLLFWSSWHTSILFFPQRCRFLCAFSCSALLTLAHCRGDYTFLQWICRAYNRAKARVFIQGIMPDRMRAPYAEAVLQGGVLAFDFAWMLGYQTPIAKAATLSLRNIRRESKPLCFSSTVCWTPAGSPTSVCGGGGFSRDKEVPPIPRVRSRVRAAQST